MRLLIVDDYIGIHEDFKRMFATASIDSAFAGQEAIALVKNAKTINKPYPLAVVDIHLQPEGDGIATIQKIWEADPNIQIVITMVQSDYTWNELHRQLKNHGQFVVLKKPFDVIELRSLLAMLINKSEISQLFKQQQKRLQKYDANCLLEKQKVSSEITRISTDSERSFAATQALLEMTRDGIIAIGLDAKVVMYNQLFLSMWHIPESQVNAAKVDYIFRQLSSKLVPGESLEQVIHLLCKDPDRGYNKEWRLQSGQVFNLQVHGQYVHGLKVGTIFSFRDMTEQKSLENEIKYISTHDSITGFANIAEINSDIELAIAQAAPQKLAVGVLFFDINNFKQINDGLSYAAGNILLKDFANRLYRSLMPENKIARLGGDKFVAVIVADNKEDHFISIARNVITDLEKPFHINHHSVIVTTNIGISMYPMHGQDVNNLLKNADAALNEAKKMGRNHFQVYRQEFNDKLLQRMNLETALFHAIDRKELLLYYQPVMDLNTNKILCVEALLRWSHPTLGLLTSAEFMPIAEEAGLMIPIGNWVIKTACLQVKQWLEKGVMPLHISVNISRLQFHDTDFIQSIEKIIAETHFNSSLLELELSESLLFSNIEKSSQKMIELKNMGIHLVMDDFGAGYASLSCLRQFPFEKVKIDKDFIQKIDGKNEDAAVVAAVISMAKSLNLEVVAKGVETYGQLEFLRQHASDQVQGYIVQKPLNEKACFKLLQENLPVLS
jgi:diguanylate cyclase (GGDEF)-like protein